MMFNTPTTRLMWKEYRSLRNVWFVLLAIGVLLQIGSRSSPEPALVASALVIVMACLFAVASGVMSFAGETDLQTAILLRMLPMSNRALAAGKLIPCVIGSWALSLTLVVTQQLVNLTHLHANMVGRNPPWPTIVTLELIICATVAVTAVSLIASVRSQRVLPALGKALVIGIAGCLIALFVPLLVLTNPRNEAAVLWVSAVFAFGIGSVGIGLATTRWLHRWQLGALPRPALSERLRPLTFPTVVQTVTRLWGAGLARIVAAPTSSRRTAQMLVWRELRHLPTFVAGASLVGVLISGGRLFGVSGSSYLLTMFFTAAMVIASGHLSIALDRRSGGLSMLGRIGVSPQLVWLIKTLCWFAAAMLCVIVLDTADGFFSKVMTARTRLPPAPSTFHWFGMFANLEQTPWLVIAGFPIGLFACGQLMACWIRRTVLALASSLSVAVFVVWLTGAALAWDWPAGVTLLAPALTVLAAAAVTARGWMDERTGWRWRASQLLLIAVPVVVFPVVGRSMWSRQAEVALREFGPSLTKLRQNFYQDAVSRQRPYESSRDAAWLNFASVVSSIIESRGNLAGPSAQSEPPLSHWRSVALTDAERTRGLAALQPLLNDEDRIATLPPAWRLPDSRSVASAVTFILLQDATQKAAAGQPREAADSAMTAIEACRDLASQTSSWPGWVKCLDAERVALERLRLILGMDSLTNADLQSMLKRLSVIAIQPGDCSDMLWNRTLFMREVQFMVDAPSLGSFSSSFDETWFAGTSASQTSVLNQLDTAERRRLTDAMAFSAFLVSCVPLSGEYATYGVDWHRTRKPEFERAALELDRIARTTQDHELSLDLALLHFNKREPIIQQINDTIASERATLVIIQLQLYRLKQGTLPSELSDLVRGSFEVRWATTDPWSGTQFGYAPNGLSYDVNINGRIGSVVASHGQPLLWTCGPWLQEPQPRVTSPDLPAAEPSDPAEKRADSAPHFVAFCGLPDVPNMELARATKFMCVGQ